MVQKIKEYWDKRAKENTSSPAATTNDVYLRELEIITIIQTLREINLPSDGVVLDVGCGDGYSTLRIAQAIPMIFFLGIDYSENMIANADINSKKHIELEDRTAFIMGDVLKLNEVCSTGKYDVVISDRCLINLGTFKNQCKAIAQIAKHTKPNGYCIAIENFIECHNNMNKARNAVGLPEIPVRWHNLYFKEKEFIKCVEQYFDRIEFRDFASSYYFATRVVYSAMCRMRGEEPDYRHEIHQLSIKLPWVGQFSPVRMAIMCRRRK